MTRLDLDTIDFISRFEKSAGKPPTTIEIQALNRWIVGIKRLGMWQELVAYAPLLTSAGSKGAGVYVKWTKTQIVGVNTTEAMFVKGFKGNGTNAYLNLGITEMDLGDWSAGVNGRDVDRCIGHFVLDKITGAASQVHIGVQTGSLKNLIGYTVSTIDLNAWSASGTALQQTTQPSFPNWGGYKLGYVSTPNGHYLQCLASSTSSARGFVYKDGFFELYGVNSTVTAKVAPSIPYFLGALNNNSTASNFSARTFGSVYFSKQRFSVHHASRSIDLCALETQFQKDLGRY